MFKVLLFSRGRDFLLGLVLKKLILSHVKVACVDLRKSYQMLSFRKEKSGWIHKGTGIGSVFFPPLQLDVMNQSKAISGWASICLCELACSSWNSVNLPAGLNFLVSRIRFMLYIIVGMRRRDAERDTTRAKVQVQLSGFIIFLPSVYWGNEEIGSVLQPHQQYVNVEWVCQHS